MTTLVAVLVAVAVLPASTPAAEPTVTLEQIMADPDWIGNAPEDSFWSDGGEVVYFERKRQGEKIRDLWRVGVDGSEPQQVPVAELSTFARPGGDYSSDFSLHAYVHAGDLFVLSVATGEVRQLTRTAERESSPHFLVGDRRVAFERGGAHLIFDLESGLVWQPAELRLEDDPAEEEPGFDDLEARQLRLYRKVREAKEDEELEREHGRELQRDDPARASLPWYLGKKLEIREKYLSPTAGHLLLVTRDKDPDLGQEGTMPNYVTRSGFVETTELRTRVGRNTPPGQELILLNLETRERHDLDLTGLPGIQEDPLADLRKSAIEWHVEKDGADREKVEKALEAPETRSVSVWDAHWTDDGSALAVQFQSIDNKDRWIVTVDLESGELTTRHRLTDPAWINWRYNEFGWLPDGRTLWYLSEESGYSHLYLLDVDAPDSEPRALTSGSFEVSAPQPDRDGSRVYYRANVDHPGVYEIYRVDVASGSSEQLTELGGVNDYELSPDESRLLVIHSEMDRHEELYVQAASPGAEARRLTHTVSEEFEAVDWVLPEIVEIPSSHVDRTVFSKLYKPRDFDSSRSYPAVVFVHGAGYLQNSHRGWPGYFREFMFHTLLVEHGYLVLDMDYRASAGYGRDWRTAIYRQMGHPELEDLQDGVAWLVENHSVDRDRVGVYGGSYGGFMTFMALFRDPELFAAGAALRPVTDWTHYNHGYTSNILNTPQIDPEAYQRSSPIEYAESLERPMLIAAGMQDNNVFFQDTVLLVQRLIELKKEDFETAFYPLDPHGFVHPESWLDEYRRIFKLFERYVRPE
jgi:dipeptidyl aminopeptidase/acylaminoacyl peptidase